MSTDTTTKTARELELEDLLISARAICERRGDHTAWERFSARIASFGIGSITPRTFRSVPGDEDTLTEVRGSGESDAKVPRLFYFEEGEDCWCPVPFRTEEIPGILDVDQLEPDEETAIRLKRCDMTDAEFAALPDI